MKSPRLLLLLACARPRRPQQGFSLLTGMVVLLALVAGSMALANFSSGDLMAIGMQRKTIEARAAAEAGAEQIIATFNQPENRKLLVSGVPMTSWSSSTALKSPCTRISDGTGPGSNNGQPTSQALSYGDGQFRNVENPSQVGTGTRQFQLVKVRFSAGTAGDTNRRTQTYTTSSDGQLQTTGSYSSNLINLDASGSSPPGTNTGYLTLTVKGKVLRGSTSTPSTATVTREYEILPKCCGASFGSGGAGGTQVTTNSLGSDSRTCAASGSSSATAVLLTGTGVSRASAFDQSPSPGPYAITVDTAWQVVAYPNSVSTFPSLAGWTGCMTSPTYTPSSTYVKTANCLLMNRQPGNSAGTGPVAAYNPVIINPNSATDSTTRLYNSIPNTWTSDAAYVNGRTVNGVKYYWVGPNLDNRASYSSNYSSGYLQSFWRQYCPAKDINAVCYTWILKTTVTAPTAGNYRFDMVAGIDNTAEIFIGGTIDNSNANYPTITGGQQIALRTQANNPGGLNTYQVGPLTQFDNGKGAGVATLTAGANPMYVVIKDGYTTTGALFANSSFTFVSDAVWAGTDWGARGVTSTSNYL